MQNRWLNKKKGFENWGIYSMGFVQKIFVICICRED